jgi:hypothetical protein
MTKKPHWTQTEEGKKRMSEIQKLAHMKIREVKSKRGNIRKDNTILVINGWRVILDKNEVRIERN